jgi:uncharacterized repeat protein (TIGR01451 family)
MLNLNLVGRTLLLAFGLVGLVWLSLGQIYQLSLAQGGVTLTKTFNKTSPVVRVGEVLSFTIALTNNAAFTLTNVTLLDDFDQSVLAFAGATPAPDAVDSSNGTLTWNNVAAPPLAVGQSLTFTVFFTAEHPRTTVVNMVQAQDITGTGQGISNTTNENMDGEAVGGQVPIIKVVFPPGSVPQVGLPVTFTHLITNDGAAIITQLPLTDTYDPALLQFNLAIPAPSITSPPGLLVWSDLTNDFGDLPPFSTLVVTTVFTALGRVDSTINQARVENALDQFNNILDAGQAQVPITIVDNAPTPTATPQNDSGDDDENQPAPTATAPIILTVTPAATAIATTSPLTATAPANAPSYLPETGQFYFAPLLLLALGLILVLSGWYLKNPSQKDNL